MQFDAQDIDALADALAPRIAETVVATLIERPEWAMSVQEAATWVSVPEHVIRDALKSGTLPCIRIGRSVRIRRSDLFALRKK